MGRARRPALVHHEAVISRARERLRSAVGALACALAGHRFVVWARSGEEASRHPHLGSWARCERCGAERDWLWEGVRDDDVVRDLVHDVERPLGDVIAIARGERAGAQRVAEDAARAPRVPVEVPVPALRPPRRGSDSARGSRGGRTSSRTGRDSERDPRS